MTNQNTVIDLELATKNDQNSGEVHSNTQTSANRTRQTVNDEEKYHHDYQLTCCEKVIVGASWLASLPLFLCPQTIFRTVKEYERAVIFRLGKLTEGLKGPGVFTINPFVDKIRVIDLRIETFPLAPQSMMTKDAVTVTVDAIVFMKVEDPMRAVLEVDNYKLAFMNFAATTLRSVVGTYDLESLLCHREKINRHLKTIIQSETSAWGVSVPNVEIKDVKLPANMQRAMAAEAEAERERRAKIISATGEAQAATQLANAADTIANSPGALQLRYLHTLVKISAEKNSTILFPLPMEVMRGIQSFGNLMQLKENEKNQTRLTLADIKEQLAVGTDADTVQTNQSLSDGIASLKSIL